MRGKLHFHILCILILTSTLISCNSKSESSVLDEVEFYIEEKLASISNDNTGNIWIGSETGDIYNFKNDRLTHYDLQEDIIYKAMLHPSYWGDSTLWVASRNAGLQVWSLQPLRKLKIYTIESKQDKYSPYDILFDQDDNVYVATSLGLYKTNVSDTTSMLRLVYPSPDKLEQDPNELYIYRNLSSYKDSLILGSTLDGIKVYNKNTSQTETMLSAINIEHIAVYDDTIFATTQDFLYRISSNNTLKTAVSNHPKMFFRDRNKNNFLISKDHLDMTTDFKSFSDVKLHRNIPTNTNVHNLMVDDVNPNYSLLISENAIFRIANNLNILSGKKIQASCANKNGDIYFLTGSNELYIQPFGQNRANWVFTFDINDPIVWMDISDKRELFLLSYSNTLYKIDVKPQWYRNLIDSPKKIFQTSSKITNAYLYRSDKETNCLLGSQDGLFYLSNDSVKLIPEFKNLYVTSFYQDDESDLLYISTLNDGIYSTDYGFDKIKQLPNTSDISFIKDLVVYKENVIVLINQGLMEVNKKHLTRIKGANKIFKTKSNTLFVIPQKGFEKYKIEDDTIIKVESYLEDIKLNVNTCLLNNDRLILGTDIGAIVTSPSNINTKHWVAFGNIVNIETLSIIVLVGILLITAFVALIRLLYSQKQKAKDSQLLKMKEDLDRRITDVEAFLNQPHINYSDLPLKIEEIKDYLRELDIEKESEKDKVAIKSKLETISLQIGDINRKLSIHFWINLNEQKDILLQTNHPEAMLLVEKINHLKKSDDINIIYNSINENQSWLDRYYSIIHFIDRYTNICRQSLLVENVNDELFDILESTNSLRNTISLSDLSNRYDLINNLIDRLNADVSTDLIRSKIDQLKQKTETFIVESSVVEDLNKAYSLTGLDNIASLILLKEVDNQLAISKVLSEIKENANLFKKNADVINKKYLKVGTLSDEEIQDEIMKSNKDYIKSINTYIIHFFEILDEKDLYVLNSVLKINNISSQNAKVLALLLADKNIKRTIIPPILGIYGNLNPVISRIINDRIKPNIDKLKSTIETRQSIFVAKILDLVKI